MTKKYKSIDAERMNEYLGYMNTCISMYSIGKDITETETMWYNEMVKQLQNLNTKMALIRSND